MLAGIWQARRVMNRAESNWQIVQSQPPQAIGPDVFSDLRQGNWQPTGKLITQKGRTFIELKPAK
jgi:hypothetical protein